MTWMSSGTDRFRAVRQDWPKLDLAAIPLVGPVDAIGHLPLVVALAILAVTRNRWAHGRTARQLSSALGVFLLPATLVALLVLYFYAHQAAVVANVFGHWPGTVSHVAFAGAVGYWVTRALYRIAVAGRTRT